MGIRESLRGFRRINKNESENQEAKKIIVGQPLRLPILQMAGYKQSSFIRG
jgi:hypothetical protein